MRGQSLVISADARAFICLHRPELASAFEIVGDQASIAVASLLRTSASPLIALVPSSEFRVPGSVNSEPGTRNPEPILGLGDLVAALLHRLGIRAVLTLLQRRGLLGGCRCAARQARLNALSPRLRAHIEPWPLTLAVLLSWLLLAFVLLVR